MKKKTYQNLSSYIDIILKYTLIFTILISILLSIFISNNKSFVWINLSNDGLDQHLINLHYFKNLFANFLKTGSLNTFIWNLGNGMDMFANMAYYIFGDFLSYLALLTKTDNLDNLYNILVIIRLYLVGISFITYGKYKKYQNNHILIGAITYTFSTFCLFAMARHPYFINPIILFPILLIATEEIILKDKPILFTGLIAILFITSFYFGYMLSICIFIYGLILIKERYKTKEKIIKKTLSTIGYAIIGLLLSSFILIPTGYAYLNSTRTDGGMNLYPFAYYKNLIETLISTNNTGSWSLLGVSSIILTILPTFIKNKDKHKLLFKYLIILLIPILIPFIGSMFAGFGFPNNRWSFVISFTLSLIIVTFLEKDYQIDIKNTIKSIIIYSLIIFLINGFNLQLTIAIITAIIASFIIYHKKELDKYYQISLVLIVTLNLGFNIYYMYSPNFKGYVNEFVEPNTNNLYNDANHQIKHLDEALNFLLENDKDYYNIAIYPNTLFNLSLVNNYNSHSYFYSIVDSHYLSLASDLENQELGINKEIKNFNYRTNITSLLNLKYFITTNKDYIPYGYELIKNYNNETYIYKNNYHLSFANLYTKYINTEDYQKLSPLDKELSLMKANTNDIKESNYTYNSNIEKINYTFNKNIINNTIDINKTENLIIDIPEIKNKEVYLYIKNLKYNASPIDNDYTLTATINNKTYQEGTKNKYANAYYFKNDDILINLGYYDYLDSYITLNFSNSGTYTYDSLEILALPFDNYQENINNLNNSNFNLTDYDYNYLYGTVNPTEDGILQFTTNYNIGFKVYVDNQEVKTFKSNNYFLGIEITKGYHEIKLEYTTPYKNLGLIITLFTSFIYIYIIIIEKNKKVLKK